jgi:putative tricarboxylic transport membrane protein
MDTWGNLIAGFATALTPENLLYALIGCAVGTLVGVLPGLGPTAAMAILIPLTFHLPPVGAIIMLAAIFYGSQYGGTITTILLNLPGEASSVVTVLDGHAMAKRGRAGAALSIAAIGSFVGGTVACIGLVFLSGPVASLALNFGPPEYVALVVLGLSLVLLFAGKSIPKALLMAALGMLLAGIGLDPISGTQRYTFGQVNLFDGIDIVPILMGLFGISEILVNIEKKVRMTAPAKMGSLLPSRLEFRESAGPVARGTVVGFAMGLFPGMNATIAAFSSYILEKRLSRHPERFGHGAIEGVAGPETANNAHANAALIPLFTLGIPGSPGVAILMTAFIINGLNPGPQLFTEHPEVVWPIIASMYLGNIILLALNLPLVGIWVKILKIPYAILTAFILVFCLIGAFTIDNSMFNVWVMIVFGILGYLFRKIDLPVTPLVLAFILGPVLEDSLRQSITIFDGNLGGFFGHPIAIVIFVATIAVVVFTRIRRPPKSAGDAEA